MKKEIKIKILGLAGSGKSLMAYIISEGLRWHGIHGVVIDDPDSWVCPSSDKALVKDLIIKNGSNFDVEIETVQINRKTIQYENQNRIRQ